ncbi:uncharacterized protein A1O9_05456 [Exophiala aquamarina CBS 119918]|uniref:Uncharacterized protein n=1 Tax=Exophiala aquamarina CBS 119918 TaxID=1182545 RepID=A0A072PBP7_9EURO|nr:uncharacterized protein A1O9_05456 [Exophiala aquamarina CBS 119918]KEF57539.1 hypothetical protein A1O9_05456 [Exophiala aquamarina CBS 119918]
MPSMDSTPSLPHHYTGILSRTFSSSSTIRWVLPARIRSSTKNDVVFVGETFVQLREFLDSGQLADATAKLDFGTQILAAQVISAKLEVVPIIDAILKQERDQEQYSIHGRPIEDSHPPQLLVLSTSSNELIYVYAKEDSSGDARFVFAKKSLLRGMNLPMRQCRHMAVDHDSRALAIASSSGYIAIFKLHTVADIKSQADHWDPQKQSSFLPWTEQRFIQLDGTILKMAFLRSSDSDVTKVLLILLVDSGVETNLLLYKWDTRSSLQTIRPMSCSGRPLKEDRFPLMLISSTRPYSFVAVMETGISYYENVHSMEFKRINCRFTSKTAGPLKWVQWAKPRRHNQYLQKRDDLVIVREDGLLQYFQIEKSSSTKFNMNSTVGHLGIHVDTAFCMLAGPPGKGGDIIIAGGDMTEGGVFHVSARGVPEKTQSIFNLAPVHDMIIGPHESDTVVAAPTRLEGSDRLYLCGGKSEDRAHISEIRHGMEAQLGWTMPFPDAFDILRIWTLEISWKKSLLLLTSHPTTTNGVTFDLETQELDMMDSDSLPGFDLDNPTLVAAPIDNNYIVQVTTKGIYIMTQGVGTEIKSCGHKALDCLQADIFERYDVVAIARQVSEGFEVGLVSFVATAEQALRIDPAPRPATLPEWPISVCCVDVNGTRVVILGTTNAKLLAYLVMPDLTLELAFEQEVGELCSNIEIASIATLAALGHPDSRLTMLLCGLRNGILMCLEIRTDRNDKLSIRCDDFYHLGQTTVQISKEGTSSDNIATPSALVLCDSRLYRVTLYQNSAAVDYALSALCLANLTAPGELLPEVNAVYRVSKLTPPFGEPGGLIVCATREELFFASLVAQEQTIITQLPMNGIPQRMLYSNYLKKLVVATERTKGVPRLLQRPYPDMAENQAPDPKDPPTVDLPQIEESVQVNLRIIDPDWKESDDRTSISIVEETNLHVTALIEWELEQDDQSKEKALWIVMALERHGRNADQASGRVIAVNAKNIKKGHAAPHQRVLYRSVKGSVKAICAYGRSSLLIAAGNEVILHNLDLTVRKWKTLSKYELPSPATSISCQGSTIFVATSHHSLIVLVERNAELVEHKSDSTARNLKAVITFGESCAMFSAFDNEGTHLMAFSDFNQESSPPAPMFRVNLPLDVDCIRLRKSSRPEQRDRHQFYGSTVDGTIYHFSTLAYDEWKLLHFLEELSHMDREVIKAVPMRKRNIENTGVVFSFPTTKLSDMHVRGDRLVMMVEPGPYNLRQLLRTPEQHRAFEKLAEAVVGETEHPIEAVVIWVRKLFRFRPQW